MRKAKGNLPSFAAKEGRLPTSVMAEARSPEVTQVLAEVNEGRPGAAERLMELLYAQLRAMAGGFFRGQRPGHTLQPTALVHEAYARLLGRAGGTHEFKDRAHFLATCAVAMRRIPASNNTVFRKCCRQYSGVGGSCSISCPVKFETIGMDGL